MKLIIASALLILSCSVMSGCANSPYDDDPLLKPPQLVEEEKEKKS